MKFNSLNFIEQPLKEQDLSCDSPPGEGGIRRVTPLNKGLSRSD